MASQEPGAASHAEPGAGPATPKNKIQMCIVMDTTYSMQRWINAARDMLLSAAAKILAENPGAIISLAFVAYRDHSDYIEHSDFSGPIVIPFTNDIESVQERICSMRAIGGGDTSEDVAGGLYNAFHLDWCNDIETIKILMLVTDAPAHGKDWHDVAIDDDYPRGDPQGRCPAELVASLAERGIDMTFYKCNDTTDLMIRRFKEAHTEGASRPTGAGEDANFIVRKVAQQDKPLSYSSYHGSEFDCDDAVRSLGVCRSFDNDEPAPINKSSNESSEFMDGINEAFNRSKESKARHIARVKLMKSAASAD